MQGIGAPVAQEQKPEGGGIWDKLLSAGKKTIEEGTPTALTAMGGVGPATGLGRMALSAGTGALAGASRPGTPAERLAHAAVGGVAGLGTGVAGEAVGSMLAPRLAPDAAALTARGVILAPEQVAGPRSQLQDIVERASSWPILRNFIFHTRERTIDSFNRATINQVLEPIGATLTAGVQAGHPMIREMNQAISTAYDQVFRRVPRVDVDPPLLGEIARIELDSRGRPDVWRYVQSEWNHAFRNVRRLGPAIGPRRGALRVPPMTGEQAQIAMSDLATQARNLLRSEDNFRRDAGELLEDGRGAILEAIERQHPAVGQDLRSANRSYAMAVRANNAAVRRAGAEGRFTPGDLLQASRMGARGVRRREFGEGDSLLQLWAEMGNRALTGTLGESGTATRSHILNPVAWAAGIAGRPIYGAMAAQGRVAATPARQALGELSRRGAITAAPKAAEEAVSVTGP